MPRKKPIGYCDCGDIARYGIFRLALPASPWVKRCGNCVRIIELENKEVQEKVSAR